MFTVIITLFVSYNNKYRRCVQLGNGLNLGYNAIFDFSRVNFRPYGVPKFPNGTPLVDQPLWSVFVTKTTLYGRAFGTPNERAFDFVWREDIGLIRRDLNLELHDKLVSEAGAANKGLKDGSLGPLIVMRELRKLPEYANQRCATRIIAF